MSVDAPQPAHDPRAAFRYPDFTLFSAARLLAIIGWQMQSLAVSWQVYEITKNPLHLGYIGLVQFIPNFAFALVTGHTADRFDRRAIVRICQAVLMLCSLALAFMTMRGIPHLGLVYATLFVIGTCFAFLSPASQALIPLIVPAEHLSNAVAWNTSIWHLATIVGPGLGGFVYAAGGPATVYLSAAGLVVIAFAAVTFMRVRSGRMETAETSWTTLLAGVRYVFEHQVILGCISLDLFAVLLGGATALLPIYASKEILNVGPTGLGLLRAAPAVGALVMTLLVTHMPPMRRAGATMLWCVAGFGVGTIVFGVSRNFYLSLGCLALLGGLDMISVIVRHTLVQTLTPKAMLGRVAAVNMVFITASNELGEFESGLTARWWGAVPAVVVGGLGTLAVVALWSFWFPAMRRIGRLDQAQRMDQDAIPDPARAE